MLVQHVLAPVDEDDPLPTARDRAKQGGLVTCMGTTRKPVPARVIRVACAAAGAFHALNRGFPRMWTTRIGAKCAEGFHELVY